MKTSRIILHIDMNCFFASCEIAENPELLKKPVVIAHDDPFQRSIVLTASYVARSYGIKTTMQVREAFQLCKDIIIIEPDMDLYVSYSEKFYQYLLTITKKVEMASIDEAYVDVSDYQGNVVALADKIQNDLLKEYRLPCSIGIAPNKFLAKMASDMKKPLGITILRKRELNQYLWPLSLEEMHGVGKKTAPKLQSLGLKTIGDLANPKNLALMKQKLGNIYATSLHQRANGIDDSEVDYSGKVEVGSISNSHTFDRNIYEERILKDTLKILVNTVANRLQKKNLKAYTIGLQLKYANFRQINRSQSLETPTNDESDIYKITEAILDENFEEGLYDINNRRDSNCIRLIGVFANRIVESKEQPHQQITIFDNLTELEKKEELKKIIDGVKTKFGETTINQGYYEYQNSDQKTE
ncbi:MAG TPA: DNA polymerase IV [Bacilli bacterium]|jgi:DNA polymerase-4|nr:DNA polymerase IV [Bacilli bacterium]HOD60748.1 DNA polymerase IV [Bacilli bacterium]HOE06749.1 DNA polymerase IV [Bacilli bacterium]HOH61690.1 DNA polymerase IV [Bacilli bacterium]HOR17593.1 DNA polymerase IV [Bacilli bacterium]